ncbi:MAG: DUF3187 family protein [Pseudomonadota bacterium]
MKRIVFVSVSALFWLSLLSMPQTAQSFEIKPFYTQNQSPLSHIFGLPPMGEAQVLAPDRKEVRLSLDLASNYVKNTAANESLLLDGETTRFSLAFRYGVMPNLEAGFEIPYLIQGGGFLDGFIIDYHSAFGFPQGGRDQAPRNRLLYQYRRNNTDILKWDRSGAGLGDIRLNAAWQLYNSGEQAPRSLALRGSIKAPTGDSDSLFGSGSYDGALWLAACDHYLTAWGPVAIFGAAGMMGMTEGEVIQNQQNNWTGFGSFGIGWSPLDWFVLKIQTDAHTPFFRNSDLKELSGNAAQMVFGGTVVLGKNFILDIGVSEDILVNTAPDVVFHFSLKSTF